MGVKSEGHKPTQIKIRVATYPQSAKSTEKEFPMNTKKNVARFVINFVDKTITGTKASFNKAGKGEGAIYEELAAKIAAHPKFKLVVKEQKKRSNKAKQTYDGLNFDLMEKFIAIQDDSESLMRAYEGAKKMAKDTGSSVYPFTKKWFLGQFESFDVAEAKKAISDHNVSLVAAYTAATPSVENDAADAA